MTIEVFIGALESPPVERMGEIIILMSSVKAQSRSGSLPEAIAGSPGKKLTLSFSAHTVFVLVMRSLPGTCIWPAREKWIFFGFFLSKKKSEQENSSEVNIHE